MNKVTISDIAREAGVSKATVSRVINKDYSKASEDTIARIESLVVKYNYRPSAVAQSLKTKKTKTIGVILSDVSNPFFSSLLQAVGRAGNAAGYNCYICDSSDDPELEETHIRSLIQRKIDGLLLNPVLSSSNLYHELCHEHFPTVCLNRKPDDLDVSAVLMNNSSGTYMAAERLIKCRRKNVRLFIFTPEGRQPRVERIMGYKNAMHMYGYRSLAMNGVCYLPTDCGSETVAAVLHEMKQRGQLPDAVIGGTSRITLMVYGAARRLGLRIPEDIAVLGYNEDIWSPYLEPALTTIYQPADDMGTVAMTHLLSLIADPVQRAETICLDPKIIVRKSCGTADI